MDELMKRKFQLPGDNEKVKDVYSVCTKLCRFKDEVATKILSSESYNGYKMCSPQMTP